MRFNRIFAGRVGSLFFWRDRTREVYFVVYQRTGQRAGERWRRGVTHKQWSSSPEGIPRYVGF